MKGYSPLEQFKVLPIINLGVGVGDLTITNAGINTIIVGIIGIVMVRSVEKVIPNNYQIMMEGIWRFIGGAIQEQIGKEGKRYIGIVVTVFIHILGSNMLGLIPYNITITSQVIVTFGFSITFWLGITMIGIIRNGKRIIYIFLPSGIPTWLVPIIMPIEMLSYLTRPISLGIRLAANMFAGHTLLNIIAYLTWQGIKVGGIIGIIGAIPAIGSIITLMTLEMVICILQSHVFTVLIVSYINDVINIH
jgi:ATP synthase subunit 6